MRFAFLLVVGCPEAPKQGDTAPDSSSWPVWDDEDGDGYFYNEGDCNDGDANVNPGEDERCDGLDNNCDGQIDEGLFSTFYADADTDGFGDPEVPAEACEVPSGYVTTGTDCDDSEATVYPSAAELCDALDNDCDGETDEGVETVRYIDGDGDGYGDPVQPVETCDVIKGTVVDATDCDDLDIGVHPGAEERCNGVDDDCDGSIDEDPIDLSTWYLDYDADGYGGAAYTTAACDAPAGYVASATDCDDTDSTVHPAASEVCDGADQDCDGEVDEGLGYATWYDDADRDGHGDATTGVSACSTPAGSVSTSDDCDDTDAAVSPSEAEVCDGVDNDCSGAIDDGGVCPCDVVEDGVQSWQLCTDAVTWSDASTACTTQGWQLAAIDDASEDAYLRAEVGAYSTDYYWWIGYTDGATEGTWLWSDGSGSTYTNWNSGEPNDLFGEDCATFAYTATLWNDWECTYTTSYICEP